MTIIAAKTLEIGEAMQRMMMTRKADCASTE
jgi:hypothetical protein